MDHLYGARHNAKYFMDTISCKQYHFYPHFKDEGTNWMRSITGPPSFFWIPRARCWNSEFFECGLFIIYYVMPPVQQQHVTKHINIYAKKRLNSLPKWVGDDKQPHVSQNLDANWSTNRLSVFRACWSWMRVWEMPPGSGLPSSMCVSSPSLIPKLMWFIAIHTSLGVQTAANVATACIQICLLPNPGLS